MIESVVVGPDKVTVLAVINESPRDWVDSVRSLLSLEGADDVVVACLDGAAAASLFVGSGAELAAQWTLSGAIEAQLSERPDMDAVLVVTGPVSVPKAMLERGLAWMRDDPRIATVSFLSNSAGYLSFPHRNTGTPYGIEGRDESGVTRVLRAMTPDIGPTSLPMPAGSAVLVNRRVLDAVGGFRREMDANPRESIAELALRSSRRGFRHVLDSATYVTLQWSQGFGQVEPCEDPGVRHRLHREDASFPSLYDAQKHSDATPLAIALDVARSKVSGLRVLIDGSCLGPMEMGTQVQTMELIRALLVRADVGSVTVGVPDGRLPAYAQDLLLSPKLRLCNCHDLMFSDAQAVDILHRPFQPDRPIPWERWRSLAKRVVITLQDLIAYRIGSYHDSGQNWLEYRRNISAAARNADAVVAISDDTRASLAEEYLDVSSDRTHTIKNGSNHLDEQSVAEIPVELIERGMAGVSFALVLGASYTHKNRDLAIRVWQRLRERGHNLALVMAGAVVAKGSSRVEEALARRKGEQQLVVMPDVSSAERTWLLRHAAMVLYPTSAEGFGLVPFEAAAMGTPTVHVEFGPLRELIDNPDLPRSWDVDGLADYAERLLVDPAVGAENVRRVLKGGESLTWAETASDLVEAYRHSLTCPPRR